MTEKTETEAFRGWAILELMGHRRLAGVLGEQEIAGAPFIRIDVPAADGSAAATQFYAPAAVYCITPTTEEVARAIARRERPAPVHRFELPAPEEKKKDDDGYEVEFAGRERDLEDEDDDQDDEDHEPS